jgi:hypothetical protein
MTTQYNINKGVYGTNGWGSQFCDTIYSVTLTGSSDTTLTVPGASALGNVNATAKAQYIAVISYSPSAAVYVANNATAAVPAGNTFAKTTSELNPPCKQCAAGDVLHFISASTPSITVAFYYVPEA